jgi:hypothetical protein
MFYIIMENFRKKNSRFPTPNSEKHNSETPSGNDDPNISAKYPYIYKVPELVKALQKILAGNQPESDRDVPGSPTGKIIYWSPEFY